MTPRTTTAIQRIVFSFVFMSSAGPCCLPVIEPVAVHPVVHRWQFQSDWSHAFLKAPRRISINEYLHFRRTLGAARGRLGGITEGWRAGRLVVGCRRTGRAMALRVEPVECGTRSRLRQCFPRRFATARPSNLHSELRVSHSGWPQAGARVPVEPSGRILKLHRAARAVENWIAG
jgi:hypothetical protein